MSIPNKQRPWWQTLGLLLGPIIAVGLALFYQPDATRPEIGYTVAVVALMAIWWMTEAVPLAATSLLPFFLFPLLGIMDASKVASSYMNPIIFLFLGGFLIALAMERWQLHRRIALAIISAVGSKPSSIVLGFMLATGFISMWISNTATAVMMLPIGLAMLTKVEEAFGVDRTHSFAVCIMLGIGYAASIGGVATLIGTPPNMVLPGIYNKAFPQNEPITFGKWLIIGLPFATLMLAGTWLLLTKVIFRLDPSLVLDPETVRKERSALGPMSFAEKAVGTIFVAAALLWIFRVDMDLGAFTIPGWQGIWKPLEALNDGSIAIGLAMLFFIIPSRSDASSEPLLDDQVFSRVPWSIILLFGGGFAMADGLTASGTSNYLGSAFSLAPGTHPLIPISTVSFGVTFLSEVTSNTATAQMALPLLASTAPGLAIHPLILMISATLAASMGFMLPVATPPNAIVFSSQRIKIFEMAKAGLCVNLLGLILIVLVSYFVLPLVFKLS